MTDTPMTNGLTPKEAVPTLNRYSMDSSGHATLSARGPWVKNADAQAIIDALRAERDVALESRNEWIRENGRGGWIDNLRNSEQARRIELAALKAAQPDPFCWMTLDPFGNPHPAGDGQEGAFPVYRGNPSVEGEESEFVVQLTMAGADDEVCAASTFGPRETALAEALNYARQYEEEGVVQVYEITRTPIGGAAMAATPKEPR